MATNRDQFCLRQPLDVIVNVPSNRDYGRKKRGRPSAKDVALIVEIAQSSLLEDRAMVRIYGPGGIPVYWIINLVDRQVEVYSRPSKNGYRSRTDFLPGEQIPVKDRDATLGERAGESDAGQGEGLGSGAQVAVGRADPHASSRTGREGVGESVELGDRSGEGDNADLDVGQQPPDRGQSDIAQSVLTS